MAPKKTTESVPAAPIVDSNPFGAFINVKVNSGELHLVDKEKLINTHLVLSYSTEYAPLTGTTTEPHEGKSVYLFNFDKPFRVEASLTGLNTLLNSTVKLAMHDSASGFVLASTLLEMTPLATHPGLQGYEFEDVRMEASDPAVVLGAILHSIVITVTRREAPAGLADMTPVPPTLPRPSVSGARPSMAGARPSNSGTPPPPSLEVLPEPVFYSFLSGEDADESNVLEVVIDSIGPTPPGLLTASALAKEGKAPGKLSLALSLILPSIEPGGKLGSISLPTGSIEADGSISFGPGSKIKALVNGPQAKALLASAEEGLPLCVELARYLVHDQLQDNAWEHYHALAVMSPDLVAPLSSMGIKEVKGDSLPLVPFASPDRPDSIPSTVLPTYTSNNPKAKPLETVAADALSSGQGGWAWSQLGITLRFAKPLVASWTPPPPAGISLEDLAQANRIQAAKPSFSVASDPDAAHPAPPSDALSAYKGLITSLTAEVKALSLSKRNDDGTPMNALELNVQLECSGRYEAMKRAIAEAASRVAIERYRKAHDSDLPPYPTPPFGNVKAEVNVSLPQKEKLNQELLAVLVSAQLSATSNKEAKKKSIGRLDDLSIARECELMGRVTRAQSLHQRRILALSSSPLSPQALSELQSSSWYEYGAFCLRAKPAPNIILGGVKEVQGDPSLAIPTLLLAGRAEQCFREGLEQNPRDAKCLFALSASLLHQARVTDQLYLQEATEAASSLLTLLQSIDPEASQPATVSVSQAYILLALCHAAASDVAQRDACFASAGAAEDPSTDARLSAALLLMELGLSSLAASSLDLGGGTVDSAVNPASSPDLFLSFSLTKAHAMGTSGVPDSHQDAIDLLTELLEDHLPGAGDDEEEEEEEVDEERVRARNGEASLQCASIARTLGDVHFAATKYNEAIRAYRTSRDMSRTGASALRTSPTAPPELYANLARAYLYTNHKAYALEVFKQACAASGGRCAWSWLGAGACLLGVGSKDEATRCFDEALALDPEDSETWARLAMASFDQSREAAGACLKTAVRYGLDDPLLLSELSSVYGSKEGGEAGRRVAANLQSMIKM